MASPDEYNVVLTKISAEWAAAELSMKLAEGVNGKVVFPSNLELRYAGRRIVDALTEMAAGNDGTKITAFFDDALFNCVCARHDAVDAATLKIALDLDIMGQQLGYKAILTVYPNFADFLANLSNVQRKIATSRENRQNRDAIYEALEGFDFKHLVETFQNIKDNERIIKKIAMRDRIFSWGGLVIGIVGILFAIFT